MDTKPHDARGRSVASVCFGVPAAVVATSATAWAVLALWFDGPSSRPLAALSAAGVLSTIAGALVFVRPWRRAVALAIGAWLLVLGWWSHLPARNDRNWQPDVARVPSVEFRDDVVTVHNVRSFDYDSETRFTEHWVHRTFDLRHVTGADLFLSYWGPTLIAHTIMSWEFDDGRHLAISIETRKEVGESYSALRGFFRQYELYYVVADERDVVRLRTNFRGEQVFLYRLRASPERARATLRAYLEEIDRLSRTPDWYNAFTHNCTTTIRRHAQQAGVRHPWSWRILANGKGDEYLYSVGALNTALPFTELRARSDITAQAKAADRAADFSARIREGLPPRPAGE
jgi:hypothetical protein